MGMSEKLYATAEWITRLAIVNLLWLLFTIVGLGIFGFFPATIAMFSVTRKWVSGDVDIPIFKTFWNTYKREFIQANILALIFYLLGIILYVDLMYTRTLTGWTSILFVGALFSLCIFYVIILVYIFPLFAHYKLTSFQYIKRAFLFGIINPFRTLMMIVGSFGISYMVSSIPGLSFFFLGSIISIFLTWMTMSTIKKLEKQEAENHQA